MAMSNEEDTPKLSGSDAGGMPEVLTRLEEHFAGVVGKLNIGEKGHKVEDRALKVTKLLSFMDERGDDSEADLRAMKRFVEFCLQELTEDEMQPVRKAVRLFTEHIRRNHQ
jgi:hypothetical protein